MFNDHSVTIGNAVADLQQQRDDLHCKADQAIKGLESIQNILSDQALTDFGKVQKIQALIERADLDRNVSGFGIIG